MVRVTDGSQAAAAMINPPRSAKSIKAPRGKFMCQLYIFHTTEHSSMLRGVQFALLLEETSYFITNHYF